MLRKIVRWLALVGGFALTLGVFAGAPGTAAEGEIWERVPEQPSLERSWVIYLHGRIVEEAGRRPTHPRWGVYEYPAILEALAAEGFEVVSEARPSGTVGGTYADRVVVEVRRLIEAGVPARRIGVVGFSKGGAIAAEASARLGEPDVRWVILAGCFGRVEEAEPFSGRVLSLRERSDELALSCRPRLKEATDGSREEVLETGLEHGAFYTPDSRWLDRVVLWLRSAAQR